MSLTLTTYPVIASGGKINNAFAGFQEIEVEYKREDIQISGIASGAGSVVEITVSGNITSELNVGEWIYLYSKGLSYTYDLKAKVSSIVFSSPNTVIEIESPFIQITGSGYLNYKQNYFVEAKLVDKTDNNILIYPTLFSDNGTADGIVKLNVSQMVDLLKSEILENSGEKTKGRIQAKLMYREVWREDDTQAFILEDKEPIVVIYAADQPENEKFINSFDVPKVYAGYPFMINLLHTLENNVGERVKVTFDELDINKDILTANNQLHSFAASEFGILQTSFKDKVVPVSETAFIRFKATSIKEYDYATGDYNDTDYLTENTP